MSYYSNIRTDSDTDNMKSIKINYSSDNYDSSLLKVPVNSDSAADIDLESNSHTNNNENDDNLTEKQCRICLESDNIYDFISPCYCKGDSEWVHRSCLDSWRATNLHGKAFTNCSVCMMEYVVQQVIDDPVEEAKRVRNYRLYVARDIGNTNKRKRF